jgi:N-acetylglucosamine kinase-like BadF-type ATPase
VEALKYVIGIDGGGTKTALRVSSLKGATLAEITAGSTNVHSTSAAHAAEVLYSMLDSALSMKSLVKEDCMYLCMGAAGADREDERKLLQRLFEDYGFKCPIYIANDAEIMLAAGAGRPEGIVVISGTGSIAYGRDKYGSQFRSGGWGHLIGDEGSGYWIGKEAINAAVRYFDRRDESTMLLDMLMARLNLREVWDFIGFVYSSGKEKGDIAALASVVDEAFLAGDRVALKILINASKELFLICNAVAKRLNFKEDFCIVTGGGVFEHNSFLYNTFCSYVMDMYPKAYVKKLSKAPVTGAVDIALHMLEENE